MKSLKGIAANGMSSLQGHVEGRGSMPLVAMVLILLLTLSACRSHRQRLETIALSQRQSQQMMYHDTLWQSLSLQLEGVTVEWHPDSISPTQGTIVRATAERAELSTQRQARTEVQTMTQQHDSLTTNSQWVEETPSYHGAYVARRVWCLVLLGAVIAAFGCYLLYRMWNRIR